MVLTYMVEILRQKNVSVLHPGEIFGWREKPEIMKFVGPDGVHLNVDGEGSVHEIIERQTQAFKLEREKAVAVQRCWRSFKPPNLTSPPKAGNLPLFCSTTFLATF